MKLKGFGDALNTGGIEVALVHGSNSHTMMSCVLCDFTSPNLLYGDCHHVFCTTCCLQLDDDAEVGDLIRAYCMTCAKAVNCMRLTVPESFVALLECYCPVCSTSMKISELKDHLRVCLFTPKAGPKREQSLTPYSSASEGYAIASDGFSMCYENDVLSNEKDISDFSTVTSDITSLRKMMNSLRQELLAKMADNLNELNNHRYRLNSVQEDIDDLRGIVISPSVYVLRLRDITGTIERFYSPHVTIGGWATVYFVACSAMSVTGCYDVNMYVDAILLDRWRWRGPVNRVALYVTSLTAPKNRVGPFLLENIPTNQRKEPITGFAYTFTSVFVNAPKHNSAIQVDVEYV